MGRLLPLAALLALVPVGPALAAKPKPSTWAKAEIELVTAHGLLGGNATTFKPDAPITRGDLAALLAGLTGRPQAPVASPASPLDLQGLDARLVYGLGLKAISARFAAAARDAGIDAPPRFGTEVVARLLGLRTNHPVKDESLERLPAEPASRAEAAYSAAQILRFRGWELEGVRAAADGFTIPTLSDWQRRILATAFGLVGYPYVWGGTSETTQLLGTAMAPGGFDCSGFVWRVYKQQPDPAGRALASTLKGRTTFQMSAEVPKAKRIGYAALQPADVIFFGARGPASAPSVVDHMAIYVGNGWFVHSSVRGVALERLQGWYRQRFAWGRRPLAEAGLA